jgi:hypothetical protein
MKLIKTKEKMENYQKIIIMLENFWKKQHCKPGDYGNKEYCELCSNFCVRYIDMPCIAHG